jgi:peptidoglycan/xylan/chitin deacetylase (PgdA/CDA1 family)
MSDRDLVGYGPSPPDPRWRGGARLAISFVLNYEEGGERSVLEGDPESESYLQEVVGAAPSVGRRNLGTESMFEFGSRVGFWRVHRIFTAHGLPLTVYAVGRAIEQNPAAARAMVEAGWEVASHGWRWFDYAGLSDDEERDHMHLAIEAIERACGTRPVGWYTGRNTENTRRLVVEEGGFLYDSDYYGDELPFWRTVSGRPHLIVPYSLKTASMPVGWAHRTSGSPSSATPSTCSTRKARRPQDDVSRPAHAADWPSGPCCRSGAPARLRRKTGGCMGGATTRYSQALGGHASLSG